MVWSRYDPGAGDPGSIRASATARATAAKDLRDGVVAPIKIDAQAASDVWQGQYSNAFELSVGGALTEVTKLASQYDNDARALSTYAGAVEGIAADANALRERQSDQRETLLTLQRRETTLKDDPAQEATLQRVQSQIRSTRDDQADSEHGWDSLVQRRVDADAACVASLNGTASLGGYAATAGGVPNLISDADLLTLLQGLTGPELEQLIQDNPWIIDRIEGFEDAAGVAQWWQSIGDPNDPLTPSPTQDLLLTTYPRTFGNLDGIWYTHRDIANTIAFEEDYERLEDLAAQYYGMMQIPDHSWETDPSAAFIAQYGYTPNSFAEALADARGIHDTLVGEGDYPYQLIIYNPGHPSTAAIAVGNMDTATQVTTNVPGMGTTVGSSMQNWTMSAENVMREQAILNARFGDEDALAVVAWIGYDTPEMATNPSLEVISSDNAERGAPQLVDFLEGVTATRGWDPGENLSVIAHSYGTTTASLALTETPVESFVMLGSAGLDNSITNVSDLQVDSDNVWASEAYGDNIANLGRGAVQIDGMFGGSVTVQLPGDQFEHHVNPTSSSFGANVFSSEDGQVGNQTLPGSDWHSASPQVDAEITGEATDDYGYLDWGTNPLRNASLLSLGLDPAMLS